MSILKKGTKSYSIWHFKCPRCHEGDMFETGSFSLKKPFDMHARCPKCNLNYEPEPGYYYGSMFISYIWTAFLYLFVAGFSIFVLKYRMVGIFVMMSAFTAIFFVWIFRISRLMWINIDVSYKPNS